MRIKEEEKKNQNKKNDKSFKVKLELCTRSYPIYYCSYSNIALNEIATIREAKKKKYSSKRMSPTIGSEIRHISEFCIKMLIVGDG